jgi:hypothetical protein
LVLLIACQNGCRKAKLLNFKTEWLRHCNDEVLAGRCRRTGDRSGVTPARKSIPVGIG